MTALSEERLAQLRHLVPPVLSPPIGDVHRRADRLRRTRSRRRWTSVAAVVVLAGGAAAVAAVLTRPGGGEGPAATRNLSCADSVTTSPLPVWARDGFTPPDQAVPHVTGATGDIVGVLFAQPLYAPGKAGQGNKILWVADVAGGGADNDLKIHATLNGSNLSVDRVVDGGPGPSLIDVPLAGCWTFSLSWGRYHDAVAVAYAHP